MACKVAYFVIVFICAPFLSGVCAGSCSVYGRTIECDSGCCHTGKSIYCCGDKSTAVQLNTNSKSDEWGEWEDTHSSSVTQSNGFGIGIGIFACVAGLIIFIGILRLCLLWHRRRNRAIVIIENQLTHVEVVRGTTTNQSEVATTAGLTNPLYPNGHPAAGYSQGTAYPPPAYPSPTYPPPAYPPPAYPPKDNAYPPQPQPYDA